MRSSSDLLTLYTLKQSPFFEQPSSQVLDIEFRHLALALLPNWKVAGNGIWLMLQPVAGDLPEQGWKIHVSVNFDCMAGAIENVAKVCDEFQIPFKILADLRLARQSQTHIWSRGQGGKCMALYPADDSTFVQALPRLDAALTGCTPGPHVLTDHPYGESGCVFYRYGAFQLKRRPRPDGSHSWLLKDQNGDYFEDSRDPWPWDPAWVTNPFPATAEPEAPELTLHGGQFQLVEAKKFTNLGGVYVAVDSRSGQNVIIKEARPHVFAGTTDGQELLRREFSILEEMCDTGYTPRPVALFEESGHLFAAIEYIEHDYHLGSFTAGNNPLYTQAGDDAARQYFERYISLLADVADGLAALHDRNIVMGDLSFTNVLVTEHGAKLIDFGGAFRPGRDLPPLVATPGMGRYSPDDTFARDIRSLGYLIAGGMIIPAAIAELSAAMPFTIAHYVADNLGYKHDLVEVAEAAAAAPGKASGLARDYAGRLRHLPNPVSAALPRLAQPARLPRPRWQDLMHSIATTAELSELGTLYHLDPLATEHSTSALAWGAGGVLWMMSNLGIEPPPKHVAWWLDHIDEANLPAGLYSGLSGVSLLARRLGYDRVADRLLRQAITSQALSDDPSFFQGAAGVGIACIETWRMTGRELWRERAEEQARNLLAQRERLAGDYPVGLAYGGAGQSLLLLALAEATTDQLWAEAGAEMLRLDLAQVQQTEWDYFSTPRLAGPDHRSLLKHYLYEGSAGLVSALARWYHVTKNEEWRQAIAKMAPDCSRLLTGTAGLLTGLSGLGMSLLDAYAAAQTPEYLASAETIGSSLGAFVVEHEGTPWICGDQNVRLSADLANGTAGVAAFLWRLEEPSGRSNPLPGLSWRCEP